MHGPIRVKVKAFATFRNVMDPEIAVELDAGSTVSVLLDRVISRFPALEQMIFVPPRELRPFVIILKNGRNIVFLDQLDTTLEDGDVIALFPPVAGG